MVYLWLYYYRQLCCGSGQGCLRWQLETTGIPVEELEPNPVVQGVKLIMVIFAFLTSKQFWLVYCSIHSRSTFHFHQKAMLFQNFYVLHNWIFGCNLVNRIDTFSSASMGYTEGWWLWEFSGDVKTIRRWKWVHKVWKTWSLISNWSLRGNVSQPQ